MNEHKTTITYDGKEYPLSEIDLDTGKPWLPTAPPDQPTLAIDTMAYIAPHVPCLRLVTNTGWSCLLTVDEARSTANRILDMVADCIARTDELSAEQKARILAEYPEENA